MDIAVFIAIGFLIGLNVGLFVHLSTSRYFKGFVKIINTPNETKPQCYNQCGDTLVDVDGTTCLNCGSAIMNAHE